MEERRTRLDDNQVLVVWVLARSVRLDQDAEVRVPRRNVSAVSRSRGSSSWCSQETYLRILLMAMRVRSSFVFWIRSRLVGRPVHAIVRCLPYQLISCRTGDTHAETGASAAFGTHGCSRGFLVVSNGLDARWGDIPQHFLGARHLKVAQEVDAARSDERGAESVPGTAGTRRDAPCEPCRRAHRDPEE